MADGIAVPLPGRRALRTRRAAGRRHRDGDRGGAVTGLLLLLERAKLVVEPAGAAGWLRCWTTPPASSRPSSSCSPAATSTRCCCCACCVTAWRRPAATCRFRCGCRTGRERWRSCWRVVARGRRQRRRGRARPHRRPQLRVDEVEIALQLETRGPEHCGTGAAGLRDGWLPPRLRLTTGVRSARRVSEEAVAVASPGNAATSPADSQAGTKGDESGRRRGLRTRSGKGAR